MIYKLLLGFECVLFGVADHLIDIGPEGGRGGGVVVASGTPEQIVKNKQSITGKYLKEEL